MAEIGRGNIAAGVNELRMASELNSGDVEYRRDWLQQRELATNRKLAQAEAHAEAGRWKEAEAAYREVQQFDQTNVRAQVGLEQLVERQANERDLSGARGALKAREIDKAAALVNGVLDRQPHHAEARKLKQELDARLSQSLPANPSLSALYRKPVNLEFRDANIRTVFDALSRTSGINFIFDRDVKPELRTTVVLKQTPFEDAVDVILSTNQLEKKVLNGTTVLIYPNTPAKLKEHQDLLVKAFYLSNIDAKTAANLLKTVLKIKDVFIDEKYHMLVLRENAETIALAAKLIALQDLEDPEVMLEVEVVEVNRSRLLNLGIQVSNQLTIAPLAANNVPTSGTGSNPSYRLSDLLDLDKTKLGVTVPSATLNLQKTDGDANLLANPRLRVRDRDRARFLIGDKVPVVTTTTTPNGFLSENVQYLDVGLKLEVEPEIYLHDEIGLKLSLEVSSLVGSVKTATGSQAYQIGTRNFSSSLRLRDGETQVLAGLISDADRSDANRIPLLGDLPMLGRLFSSQKDDRQKTEIIMSITPHLIRNIQRKSVGAEAFWSGTETTLRTKVGSSSPGAVMEPGAATAKAGQRAAPSVPDASGLVLRWAGPTDVPQGTQFAVELQLESMHELRALPLQLAYDPRAIEVTSVQMGDFFARTGDASFGNAVDKKIGRISVGLAAPEARSSKGKGTLVRLEMKALAQGETEISLVGATPIGAASAVKAPQLPVAQQINIE